MQSLDNSNVLPIDGAVKYSEKICASVYVCVPLVDNKLLLQVAPKFHNFIRWFNAHEQFEINSLQQIPITESKTNNKTPLGPRILNDDKPK